MNPSEKRAVMRVLSILFFVPALCAMALAEGEAGPSEATVKAAVVEHAAQLGSDEAGVRFKAAVQLGKLRHPDAIAHLLPVLAGDPDLFVRRACARSLGHIRRKAAVPGLIEALVDKEVYVGLECSKALRRITGVSQGYDVASSPEARSAVRDRWRAWWKSLPPEQRVDKEPWKPTAAPPKPSVDVEALLKDLSAEDTGRRFTATVRLGKARDARAVGPLCKRLATDTDLFVRRACARALGEIGSEKAVPALIDALTDEEIFVALEAAKVLRKVTGVAPDLRVEGGGPSGFPTPEQRREAQAKYRTWWEGKGGKEKEDD
jgi:HEAT repeat protein